MQNVTTVELKRDCEAVQIPAGNAVVLTAGTPADITQTVGNPAKAARELGWRATLNFEKLIAMMIEADLARIAGGGALT